MTKKHFIELADALRDLKPRDVEASDYGVLRAAIEARNAQWCETCAAMASFCRAQNPRFDTPRWFGYIDGTNGPNGEKRK